MLEAKVTEEEIRYLRELAEAWHRQLDDLEGGCYHTHHDFARLLGFVRGLELRIEQDMLLKQDLRRETL